jgi:hypothetical protein
VDFYKPPKDARPKPEKDKDVVLGDEVDTDIHMRSPPARRLLRRRENPSRWHIFSHGMVAVVVFLLAFCMFSTETLAMGTPPSFQGQGLRKELDDDFPSSRPGFDWHSWTDWDPWGGEVYQELDVQSFMLATADTNETIRVPYNMTPHKNRLTAIVDSGCTLNITNELRDLVKNSIVDCRVNLRTADGKQVRINKKGTMRVMDDRGLIMGFYDTLYLPTAPTKLMSTCQLNHNGMDIALERDGMLIIYEGNKVVKSQKNVVGVVPRASWTRPPMKFKDFYETVAPGDAKVNDVMDGCLAATYTGDLTEYQVKHRRMMHMCQADMKKAYPKL